MIKKTLKTLPGLILCILLLLAASAAMAASFEARYVTLIPGEVHTLRVIDDDGGAKTWESAKPAVATVSDGGVVTAQTGGETEITCKLANGSKLTCTVYVATLSETSATLQIGEKVTFYTRNVGYDKPTITWSSSDESVISPVSGERFQALRPGKAKVSAKVGNCKGTLDTEVTVESASLSETSLDMDIGGYAIIYLKNVHYLCDVDWSSDDTNVVTVEEGIGSMDPRASITAVGTGTTTIRATLNGCYNLTAQVKVGAASIEPSSVTLGVGEKTKLKLVGASVSNAKWTSSNTAAVTLHDPFDVAETMEVVAKSPGTSTVSVTSNGKIIASATVKVASVSISPDSASIGIGETVQLKISGKGGAIATPEEWTSSDANIATVDDDGKVVGKGVGKATITVILNGEKAATATVTVKPALSAKKADVAVGETVKLKVKGAGKSKITWKSSNPKIATVNKKGVVKAGNKTGKVTITAKFGSTKLKCKVTVRPKVVLEFSRVAERAIYNDAYINVRNYSKKKVVYVKFNIIQYNNAGKKLKSPYDYFYLNETVKAKSVFTGHYWWVHDDTKKVKLKLLEVTFAGGSKWRP